MIKEYTIKEMRSLIDFTLENPKLKSKTIFQNWKKEKQKTLSKEELKLLKDYEIYEQVIFDDVIFLSIKNMAGVSKSAIKTIMQKMGTCNYHEFFNDDYSSYWEKMILINLNKINFDTFKSYDNDKYMKIYEDGPFLLLNGPDYLWKEEFEEVNDYSDKYSFDSLIPYFQDKGYSSYFDNDFTLSRYFRLLVNHDYQFKTAINFLNEYNKEDND